MPRLVATEEPAREVCRYLRYWTNPDFVVDEIHSLHAGVPAELTSTLIGLLLPAVQKVRELETFSIATSDP